MPSPRPASSCRLPAHRSLPPLQVYLRQGKLLLAAAAAKKAAQLAGAADSSVHSMACRLADAVVAAAAAPAGEAAALPPAALEVAQEEAAALLGASEASAASAAAYRQQWAAAHASSSVRHAAAAAEVAAPQDRPAAVQQLLGKGPAGASHADCLAAHELLSGPLGAADAAEQWRQACGGHFRWSAVFSGADRVAVPAPWEQEAGGKEAAGEAAVNGIAEKTSQLAI